jgi:uncharacterized protein (TIGR02597 family)
MKHLCLTGLILGAPLAGWAQYSAHSPPVGGVVVTFASAQNGLPKLTTFTPALRLFPDVSLVGRKRGTLSGVTTNTLSDQSAGWAAGALSQAAAPYFVRMRSGAAEGTWWHILPSVPNTATTVTVGHRGINPLAAGVAAGDRYEIVPADTLHTFFAEVEPSIGGATATTADIVRIHDGVIWRDYHFNTAQGQWREGTAPFNRNHTVLRPDAGVIFLRRAATDVAVLMVGNVSTGPEKVTISATGTTAVGNVFPVPQTLSGLAFNAAPGLLGYSGDSAAADKIRVWDGVTWRVFVHATSMGQWREGTAPFNRNSFTLPLVAPAFLERAPTGGTAFMLTLVPPYSL